MTAKNSQDAAMPSGSTENALAPTSHQVAPQDQSLARQDQSLARPVAAGGSLFIVAAPSGAGKTSLVAALLAARPNIQLSISLTTRAARPSEQDGRDYHFVSQSRFDSAVASEQLLEWAQVHDNWYGTSRQWVADKLAAGMDVLLEIDWQGARQVRRMMPRTIGIFILPPSLEALRERLKNRGHDSDDVIERRLVNAQEELQHVDEFEYTLVNQDFAQALNQFKAIVDAAGLRTAEQAKRFQRLFDHLDISTSKPKY